MLKSESRQVWIAHNPELLLIPPELAYQHHLGLPVSCDPRKEMSHGPQSNSACQLTLGDLGPAVSVSSCVTIAAGPEH